MKKEILIIGAGLAGLAAARKLVSQGYHIKIIEARNRIGGRTWTNHSWGFPFDEGAFIMHGIKKNPITSIADQLKLRYQLLDSDSVVFDKERHTISQKEQQISRVIFNEILFEAKQYALQMQDDISLHDAIYAILNRVNMHFSDTVKNAMTWYLNFISLYTGGDLETLSGRYWDLEETLEGGNHLFLDGYSEVVNYLAQGLEIILNDEVTLIKNDVAKVIVETKQHHYEGDFVIVTVPLGVLKKECIEFYPSLSDEKQKSINRLDMGVLNKIGLKFQKPFWPTQYVKIGYCADTEISGFLSYAKFYNVPVLIGAAAGKRGMELEKLDDEIIRQRAMTVLREIFGNHISEPEAVCITRWSQDPFSFGSYSYTPKGATGQDYDNLSTPEGRIFFAGEATHRQFPATAHGAYLSGIREADRVLQL